MNEKKDVLAHGRRAREEIQQSVADFLNSGMRRSEFCRIRGLSFSTLDRHLKKQRWKRTSRRASSAGRLMPVELNGGRSPAQYEPSSGLAVALPGGGRIEGHPDFDTNTFERPTRQVRSYRSFRQDVSHPTSAAERTTFAVTPGSARHTAQTTCIIA
jgi:hypothetical protein